MPGDWAASIEFIRKRQRVSAVLDRDRTGAQYGLHQPPVVVHAYRDAPQPGTSTGEHHFLGLNPRHSRRRDRVASRDHPGSWDCEARL